MSDKVFDDLARALAEPMPRRRALRVLGATLAMTAVPGLRPGAASGRPRRRGQGCPNPTSIPCPSQRPKCCVYVDPIFGPGSATCCGADQTCPTTEWPSCLDPCPNRKPRCGRFCCGRNEACVRGRCVKTCPSGRARCGSRCCPKGYACVRGRCSKCPRGRKSCGKKCCSKGHDCCFDEVARICCDTKRRACCPVGKPGAERMTCCPAGRRCARELDLTASGMTAGIAADSATLCCPERRFVPSRSCCPPGHVSLGGRLVLPAGGGGGQCCREDKLCGEDCCSTGVSPTGQRTPDTEGHCCNGRCVSLQFDPQNCGTCGRQCPSGQRCQNGACVAA